MGNTKPTTRVFEFKCRKCKRTIGYRVDNTGNQRFDKAQAKKLHRQHQGGCS